MPISVDIFDLGIIVRKRYSVTEMLLMILKLMGNRNARSSHPEVFYKKGVLRNFAKFTEKHLCQGLFFNKVAGLQHFQEHLF